jgi:hypothetical protein
MIRVIRPAAVPAVLAAEGNAKSQEHCAAYVNGAREFKFDATIYGDAIVKESLVAMHHGKCCYCESKVRHTGPGTIDHYRPKAASQQRVGVPFSRPGYYWLAYHWENLLLECVECNQTHKRNLFPLVDENQRALSHFHHVANEAPLLLDPSNPNDDPLQFISFRDEYAFALNGNQRGQATINILALNDRPDLVEQRREKITVLRIIQNVVRLLPETAEAQAAQQYLDSTVLDTAQYAAMSRAFCANTSI